MHIGILGGTGPAGSALALRLAASGHQVTIGSRAAERAAEVAAGLVERWPDRELSLTGAANADAAGAEVVVVATPWDAAEPTVAGLAAQLRGTVVISMANALTRIGKEFQPLVGPRGSVAAGVAAAAPESLVVAAFQHLPAKELGDLDRPLVADVLLCSDHRAALDVVTGLVEGIGGLRALEAGGLAQASAVESFTAVLLQLNVRYKTRATLRLAGIPDRSEEPGA